MNLVLLEPADLVAPDRARLSGRRARHVLEVHGARPGDELRIGLLGGLQGRGVVVAVSGEGAPASVELNLTLDQAPPPPLALTLVLALPRPRVLKRALQSLTAQGVKRVVLVNSWRVDKSYWKSPALAPASLGEQLVLGLEQARDTVLPELTLEPLFKPFVEDRLPALLAGTRALAAHPAAPTTLAQVLAAAPAGPTTLCVGPEGGWIDYEVEKLAEAGCTPVALGPRILRVEDALTSLLARLG